MAGRYSYGSGIRFDSTSAFSPPQFQTSCTNQVVFGGRCDTWSISNGQAESGDQNQADLIYSKMELTLLFVSTGSISFQYKVDAEPGRDGLTFDVVGDIRSGEVENLLELTSQEPNWVTFEFSDPDTLSPGYHKFIWTYSKDLSGTYGQDKAWIKDIKIDGVSFGTMACIPCPPGTFSSLHGQPNCKACPQDTYSPTAGATACLPCPSDQYALPQSASCTNRSACALGQDYIEVRSRCIVTGVAQGQQTVSYQYLPGPIVCAKDLITLPPNQTVACAPAPCPGGQYRNSSTGACSICPSGYVSPANSISISACTPCPAGTSAIQTLPITDFSTWPDIMLNSSNLPNTACTGQCHTSGWQLANDYIFSGMDHGDIADITLNVNLQLYRQGYVKFNYSMVCPAFGPSNLFYAPRLSVLVDGERQFIQACGSTNQGQVVLNLADGVHVLTFIFSKKSAQSLPQDFAAITYFYVEGIDHGGASECRPCVGGHYSSPASLQCFTCPAGSFSNASSAACSPCPAGTFASFNASSECFPCGPGTVPNADATDCSFTCGFTSPTGQKYNLTQLSIPGGMYGPFIAPDGESEFLFNICERPSSSDNSACVNPDTNAFTPLYACYVNDFGIIYSGGYAIGFQSLTHDGTGNTSAAAVPGVQLTYSYGDPVVADDGTVLGRRSTVVNIVCDANVGVGSPVLQSATALTATFLFRSMYGCTQCSLADYIQYTTRCEDGHQFKKYDRRDLTSPYRCVGGLSPPAPVLETCSSSKVSTGVVLGVLIPCLILVPLLAFLYSKYKKYRDLSNDLSVQYDAINKRFKATQQTDFSYHAVKPADESADI